MLLDRRPFRVSLKALLGSIQLSYVVSATIVCHLVCIYLKFSVCLCGLINGPLSGEDHLLESELSWSRPQRLVSSHFCNFVNLKIVATCVGGVTLLQTVQMPPEKSLSPSLTLFARRLSWRPGKGPSRDTKLFSVDEMTHSCCGRYCVELCADLSLGFGRGANIIFLFSINCTVKKLVNLEN